MDECAVESIERIGHDEAMAITAIEIDRFGHLLASVAEAEWDLPTDCARWSIADVAAHVIGAAAAQASPREFARQVRRGRRFLATLDDPAWWDGMNELQVTERRGRTPSRLLGEWSAVAPRALRARQRLPRLVGALPVLQLPPPIGRQPLRYLFDMGFTRDAWMHRIDIEHARGSAPVFDAAHDGRIVADIVAEWAASHGEAFRLVLEGAAGGTFVQGSGGDEVRVDVVEFCRCLTERREGTGVLARPLPL